MTITEEYNNHLNNIRNNKPIDREFGDPPLEPTRETLRSRILKDVYIEGEREQKKEYNRLNEEITRLILFDHYIKTLDFSPKTEMCIYENGVYKRKASNIIQSIIKNTLGELGKKFTVSRLREIMKMIELDTLCNLDDFDKNPYMLNLENELVDIRTGDSKPHSPEYLSFRRIPITYDLDAFCPEIDSFFIDIFHKEDINFILEFIGLCLTPIMEYQKAIMFYGVGNNGKTTFLNLLTIFIGEKNKSGVALHQLNSFMSAKLDRSLINVDSDQGSRKMRIKMFKQWVGNELTITINPKYMTPYDIKPNAKLLYSCNNVFPNVPNDTDKGFWRKWDLIECPNSFDTNEDKDIIESLTSEYELSGLFNRVMKAFQALHERARFEPKYQENWEKVKTFWLSRMNPFNLFIERKGEIGEYKNFKDDPKNEFWEFKEVVLQQFNTFLLKELNQKSITLSELTKTINESIKFKDGRRTIDGKRRYVYQGFKLNNYEDKFIENGEDKPNIDNILTNYK
jgi:P4 family phage/plasmid primase-like protien